MASFKKASDLNEFTKSLFHRNRHVLDAEQSRFVEAVRGSSESCQIQIPPKSEFFRAQLGPQYSSFIGKPPDVHPPTRMIPDPKFVTAGRTNHAGQAVLYGATDETTAVAELRPWICSTATLSKFATTRALRLADCAAAQRSTLYDAFHFESTDQAEIATVVWSTIGRRFATPVGADDAHLDYLPTQILAELFRDIGFDGVKFKSSIGPGDCYAIFDVTSAELKSSALMLVKAISFEVEELKQMSNEVFNKLKP